MKKRRNRSSHHSQTTYVPASPRTAPLVANRRLEGVNKKLLDDLIRRSLRLIEDRRKFDPARHSAARSILGQRMRLAVSRNVNNDRASGSAKRIPIGVRYADSKKTITCVRRNERREVLFAAGAAGGKKISRRRRRNERSDIQC